MPDWTGGQIGNNDSANDIRDVDLSQVHYLSGPIRVEGAEPGDLLVVDILDIGPLPGMQWGFTGIFARDNGGGFLTDYFPEARKAIWDFEGIYATLAPHPRRALRRHHAPRPDRHRAVAGAAGPLEPARSGCSSRRSRSACRRSRCRPTRKPRCSGSLKGAEFDRIAREARAPSRRRENGGNCDIKNLSRGSRIYFPVYVKGANLRWAISTSRQGDGEITFCGAIEMAGFIDLHVDLIKDGMDKYPKRTRLPARARRAALLPSYLVFEGISVDGEGPADLPGRARRLPAGVPERDRLPAEFGYTGEQAYMLLGTAPVEGRISGIVDIPNAVCTLYCPTEIFEFDIRPSAGGPRVEDRGQVAVTE